MSKLLSKLREATGNEDAAIVADGLQIGAITEYIDTGSYALNALLSGTIFGGMPSNRITAFAGEFATGKTWFALSIAKHFQDTHKDGIVVYFDTENASSNDLFKDRKLDEERMLHVPVSTIQEFRTQSMKILDQYGAEDEKKRPKMFMILDSLGNLSTQKEVDDVISGKEVRDMTKAQLVKGAFRVLTMRLAKMNVPMLVTNHVYDVIGSYVPTKEMGGGKGLQYAASTIVFLSKKKDKDSDNEHIGNIIKAKLAKSRFTIEGKVAETRLFFDAGLDPYYGLLEIGVETGIIKNISKKYEFPNGESAMEGAILKNPTKYFDAETLEQIDKACGKLFLYGQAVPSEE